MSRGIHRFVMRAIPFRCNLAAFYVLVPATGGKTSRAKRGLPRTCKNVETWKRARSVLPFALVFSHRVTFSSGFRSLQERSGDPAASGEAEGHGESNGEDSENEDGARRGT